MLMLNLSRVMRLRGVEHHYRFLLENGFVPATAKTLLGGGARTIRFEHLETLCALLNCAPNDLFDWHPRASNTLAPTHSLNQLKRSEIAGNLTELLKDVPLEKYAERLESLVEEMKTQ